MGFRVLGFIGFRGLGIRDFLHLLTVVGFRVDFSCGLVPLK